MYFVINGEPKGKQRPRHGRNGVVYTPKETKDYEKLIAYKYLQSKGEKLDGYIKIEIEAYYEIPKSKSKKDKLLMEKQLIRPTKTPDLDNIFKVVLDGLNGVAYEDDKQVVEIVGKKYYSYEPRVEVLVYTL